MNQEKTDGLDLLTLNHQTPYVYFILSPVLDSIPVLKGDDGDVGNLWPSVDMWIRDVDPIAIICDLLLAVCFQISGVYNSKVMSGFKHGTIGIFIHVLHSYVLNS